MSKLKEFFGKMFKADISKLKTVNEQKFQTMIDNRGREYEVDGDDRIYTATEKDLQKLKELYEKTENKNIKMTFTDTDIIIEKVAPPNPKDDAPIIGTLLEAFETAVVSINDESKPVKGIIFKDGKMIIEV